MLGFSLHQGLCMRRAGLIVSLAVTAGCGRGFEPFPARAPLQVDPDRRPFTAELEPAFSGTRWDALDKSIFRPVSQFFAVDPGGEARNVNALDEVPSSSWFDHGRGAHGLSPEAAGVGPCPEPLDDGAPWSIVGAKPNGADPGFLIKAPDGQRYLIKLDEALQSERTSLADVVGSRIYYAAGFDVPCYAIVVFDRSLLHIAPGATAESDTGEKLPLTWAHIETTLRRAKRQPDGRYRGDASRYLQGHPLGPWSYVGTRSGDRNDIIPHEDRRELRGSRLLAAWTDHSDQRDQNTLAMWIETASGSGYVRHHLIDFGDCFGSLWEGPAQQAWRRGHAYWFGPGQIVADFISFGVVERPWDRAQMGPSGMLLGYYGVEEFDAEAWYPTYPNPAFGRMTEHDAAWMARIIARIERPQLEAMVAAAELEPKLHAELVRILIGRRQKILARYLSRLSPLAVELPAPSAPAQLCATDLALSNGLAASDRRYTARAWQGLELASSPAPRVTLRAPGQPCVQLGDLPASTSEQQYWVLDLRVKDGSPQPERALGVPPLRLHLYRHAQQFSLVGVERPEHDGPPS
jgi:hypothetical protein